MKWKLIIVYKDRNLKKDEVVFEDKTKAEYLKEYYQQNDCVAYAKNYCKLGELNSNEY